jgi:hypothetical protein
MGDNLGGGIQDSLVDCLGSRPVMVSARRVSCGAMLMAMKSQGRGAYLCHESGSRIVRMTLALGYAAISSDAKAAAGRSQTAWQWPSSWSQSSLSNLPSPSHLALIACIQSSLSRGVSVLAARMWYVSRYPRDRRAVRTAVEKWVSKGPNGRQTYIQAVSLNVRHSHMVPVRHRPKTSTFIGTIRLHCRLSISVPSWTRTGVPRMPYPAILKGG